MITAETRRQAREIYMWARSYKEPDAVEMIACRIAQIRIAGEQVGVEEVIQAVRERQERPGLVAAE